MAELLVSVRSVAEAEAALAGGAAIIDVKEPSFGPLGRAADATIAAVIRWLKGRVPVSAALGELAHTPRPVPCPELSYAKWGLSGCGPDWWPQLEFSARRQLACAPGCRIVPVAYADWRLAQSPPPAEIFEFVGRAGWRIVLIDTWCKNGKTLLDWMSLSEVERFCHDSRQAGIRVALAGSLGAREIQSLLAAGPDVFAVRGAVCRQNNRKGSIDLNKVHQLVNQLAESADQPRKLIA